METKPTAAELRSAAIRLYKSGLWTNGEFGPKDVTNLAYDGVLLARWFMAEKHPDDEIRLIDGKEVAP